MLLHAHSFPYWRHQHSHLGVDSKAFGLSPASCNSQSDFFILFSNAQNSYRQEGTWKWYSMMLQLRMLLFTLWVCLRAQPSFEPPALLCIVQRESQGDVSGMKINKWNHEHMNEWNSPFSLLLESRKIDFMCPFLFRSAYKPWVRKFEEYNCLVVVSRLSGGRGKWLFYIQKKRKVGFGWGGFFLFFCFCSCFSFLNRGVSALILGV